MANKTPSAGTRVRQPQPALIDKTVPQLQTPAQQRISPADQFLQRLRMWRENGPGARS